MDRSGLRIYDYTYLCYVLSVLVWTETGNEITDRILYNIYESVHCSSLILSNSGKLDYQIDDKSSR